MRATTCFAARVLRVLTTSSMMIVFTACTNLVNGVDLPTDVVNPKSVKNDRGAESLYRGVMLGFTALYSGSPSNALSEGASRRVGFSHITGLLSDELSKVQGEYAFPQTFLDRVDSRLLFADENLIESGSEKMFKELNRIRVGSQEARGMIRKYGINLSPTYIGHLFAIEGHVTTMLADLYCSGIPLGTVDFEKDYTLTRGFTTVEVYQHAIALFDSADLYVGDSTRFANFARLGRARAQLSIGNLAQASAEVTTIPTEFVYQLSFTGLSPSYKYVLNPRFERYGDREGVNGLPFKSGGDPRTLLPALSNMASPLTLSSGVEARLIEAEAALIGSDASWLTMLNKLRTTCVTADDCAIPAPAGTGMVSGLPPLEDPAPGASIADTAARTLRLKLILTERAYWMFLTGHRQGDLRRVIRNYQWHPSTAYPIGRYWSSSYGLSMNLPVPRAEQVNPLYRGCENQDA